MSEYTLHLGDCLEYMRALSAGVFDAVVTDPPYGIGYQSNMRKDKFGKMGNDDVTNAVWLSYIVNLCKPGAAVYCFSRWDVLGQWKSMFEFFGLNVRNCIVWDKKLGGMGDLYGSYAPSHEMILFASRGDHRLRKGRPTDVISTQRIGGKRDHPTEKPVELMIELLENSTDPGDTIFDPFMGSGTTGVACMQLGRNFVGCEIDPEYYAIAEKRISEAAKQPPLFVADAPKETPVQKGLLDA